MTDADLIVVGGGHNGLICAAYLARAGIDTLLIEARTDVGGCASTVDDLGARFNICNCDHTMIRAMPVIDELELSSHGLRYLESDVSFLNMFHDGSDPWPSFHEVDRQLDALAKTYPAQVDGYRRYLADALPVAGLVVEMARTKPTTPRMLGRAISRRGAGAARLLNWSRRSAADVFGEYFDDWRMWMPAVATGPTVWGVAPDVAGTGLGAVTYATRHLVKSGRPEGGSGALPDAVRASFETAGGRVLCGRRVESLVVERGAVTGVRLDDSSVLHAKAVVAACDPHRVFVEWLGEVPRAARKRVERWRQLPVAEGYESKIDAVLSALPEYRCADQLRSLFGDIDVLGPTAAIVPSPDQLAEAHELRQEGQVAAAPTLLVNVPSVRDPTMQPSPEQHVLSLEVLFTPYSHPGGWANSSEPQRWLSLWADMVQPGILDSVDAWRVMTPDRYEAEFSMHRGHTPSYGGSPLAALFGRGREVTRYRSGVPGLYLSGAGTFPGAGIFGASGRNAADAVIRDLRGQVRRRVTSIGRGLTRQSARDKVAV